MPTSVHQAVSSQSARKQAGSLIHDVFHYIILNYVVLSYILFKICYCPYPAVAEDFANTYKCVILCTIYILSTIYETELESTADYTIDHKTILQIILQTIR